jgi:hypothetical protein
MTEGPERHSLPTVLRQPVIVAVISSLIVAGILGAIRSMSSGQGRVSSSPSTSSAASHGPPADTGSTGSTGSTTSPRPQLTTSQLTAILVAQSAYQKLPDFSGPAGVLADASNYALQGGVASLRLCNSVIHILELGADSTSSYQGGFTSSGNAYIGSDAGSFDGTGAEQLLSSAASQGRTCGWRSIPGPRLDDQVVRLTTDQAGPSQVTLHDDVILVRSGATVLEIGSAVFSGSHSSDAETLAEGAAQGLAQAEHGGTT